MAAQRQIQTDDEEMERLRSGDVAGAREVLRRKRIEAEEEQALDTFMSAHPELMDMFANRSILLAAARAFGGVVNASLLELALKKIGASLAMTPVAPPEPIAAEIAAQERKRLLGLSLSALHDEIRKKNAQKRIPTDFLAEDVAALKTRTDIRKLSGSVLRNMLYRESDGSARRLNTEYINKILQGIV